MSRTYVLPVTGELGGGPTAGLPPDLVFREQALNASPPALTRSASRQYYPFDYDPVTGIYGQINQQIVELGYIDPVELWERASGSPDDRNAPDDFIATISVRAAFPAPDGEALFTLVDSTYSPRLPSFIIPESPAVAPTPSRVATRYGLPIFSGDVILVDWFNRPATTNAALVTVNLTPCDGCELQAAVAAWEAALKDCCTEGTDCSAGPEALSVNPPAITGGFAPGPPVTISVTIGGSNFNATDVISLVSVAGVSITSVPSLGGIGWTFDLEFPPDIPPFSPIILTVTDTAGCADSIQILVFPPS